MAIERFDLKGYDLILSCSHCVAKGIIPPPDALHISYLLTPMRYAWDMYGEYFGAKRSKMIPFFIHYLRMWDVTSSQRVDDFLAISKHVQGRIRKFYRREAEVIYPPVDIHRFKPGGERGFFPHRFLPCPLQGGRLSRRGIQSSGISFKNYRVRS